MLFKSSLILALSALLISSVTVFAAEEPTSQEIGEEMSAPETGMEAFQQLIGELESRYGATCEGEEVVRCTDTAGRVMELSFTEISEGEYTFNVSVDGNEYDDLSRLKLVSPELIAELQPSLEQGDLGDQNDEEELKASDVANLSVPAEQIWNDSYWPGNTTELSARWNKNPGKKESRKTEQKQEVKVVRQGGFHVYKPHAQVRHHPSHALAIRGCNIGPKLHHAHVTVRHQPRKKTPSNHAKNSKGKRG
ncbi:MAG: hypothetical protein H7222_01850 [Methylotenera sp.]|nr:hypothetical protein [Oligoflexia bacterium]